jgi:hypothetical protein
VFSADLSAATDYISLEVLTAVADVLGIPPLLVAGGTMNGVRMSRGTLMGIPLSFPFLNLIHIYVCDKIGANRNSYYIMGDDLIALWTKSLIGRYRKLLTKISGMLGNERKSFISPTRGLFCERAYHLAPDGLRVNRQFMSVKAVTPLGKPLPRKGPDAYPGLPWELTPLLYLDTHYERLGHEKVVFVQRRVLSDYVAKVTHLARKHRISMFTPIKYGGAGLFPPKRNWRLSSKERGWFRALCAGSRVAASRLRAVKFGLIHSIVADRRASQRVSRVVDDIVYKHGGEGLDPLTKSLIDSVRSFSDDIAAAEGRGLREDVPMRTWFRTLGSIPASEPTSSIDCTFKEVRSLVLSPDLSEMAIKRLRMSALKQLPPGVLPLIEKELLDG